MCSFFFFCYSFFFFFQAEDGIRDLVRSRGLGDVYKRQVLEPVERPIVARLDRPQHRVPSRVVSEEGEDAEGLLGSPVSYTHLTLPTSDLV